MDPQKFDFERIGKMIQVQKFEQLLELLPDDIVSLKKSYAETVGFKPEYMYDNLSLKQMKIFIALHWFASRNNHLVEDIFTALIVHGIKEYDTAFFEKLFNIIKGIDRSGIDQYLKDLQ